MSRRVAINLAAFVAVFLLMIWWSVNNIITFDFIERPYEISGEFTATAGVAPASEVAYLGVNYGSVRSVKAEDGKVVIRMAIDRGKEIPAGSVARIFRKSAIGEPYIDFNPPEDFTDGGPVLQAGDVIPLERTEVPLEFSEMLRAASRVLSSVEPEQTRTVVHELALALNGRGEALRGLTLDSDAVLQTFVSRSDLLDRLSANSTRLTRTVTQHRASLSSSISDLAALSDSLRKVSAETAVVLDQGSDLLTITADLVADVKQNLDCVLSDLDTVITATTTDAHLDHLAHVLAEGPRSLGLVFATRDTEPGGAWARVHLLANPENPPTQYIPARTLPAVPAIAPCASSLTATSGQVRGTAVGTPTPASVPTTPGSRPAAAAVAIVLAAAVLGLHARRQVAA